MNFDFLTHTSHYIIVADKKGSLLALSQSFKKDHAITESDEFNNLESLKAKCQKLPTFDLASVLEGQATEQSIANIHWHIRPCIVSDNQTGVWLEGTNLQHFKEHNDLVVQAAYFENIINHIPQFLFWKDKNSTFLGCNTNFAKAANLSKPSNIIGKTDFDMPWSQEESVAYRADDQAVMGSGQAKLNIEETQTTPGGELLYLLTSKVPLMDKSNKPLGVIGMYTDITARKLAEEELRIAKQKAEEASLSKTRFLAAVSHELRTPLNGILGTTQILNFKYDNPELLSHIKDIEGSALNLLTLVNDILECARLEQGKFIFRENYFDYEKLVNDIISSLEHRLQEKPLQINIQFPTTDSKVILADEFRIKQVLLNLLDNAIKFTNEGSINIAIYTINSPSLDQPLLKFVITDMGLGISANKITSIFDAFSQDESHYQNPTGFGLGLAICRQLVSGMGGEIGVSSTPDKGSTFWFTIPLKSQKEQDKNIQSTLPTQPPARPFEKFNFNVLLVEDVPLNAKVAKALLEKLGCQITLVDTGQGALELLKAKQFDLMFIDIGLPDISGVDVTQKYRLQESPNERLPIIAMTAHAFDSDRENYLRSGIDHVINKPILQNELHEVLREWGTLRTAKTNDH